MNEATKLLTKLNGLTPERLIEALHTENKGLLQDNDELKAELEKSRLEYKAINANFMRLKEHFDDSQDSLKAVTKENDSLRLHYSSELKKYGKSNIRMTYGFIALTILYAGLMLKNML